MIVIGTISEAARIPASIDEVKLKLVVID